MKKEIIFTTDSALNEANALLRRIAQGESVSVEERLEAIKNILAFSPRDWSLNPELWILYRLTFHDKPEQEDGEDLNYMCFCGGSIVVVREKNGRKVYKCDTCHGDEIFECTTCHKPRSIWADDGNICGVCAMQFFSGGLSLNQKQQKAIAKWVVVV